MPQSFEWNGEKLGYSLSFDAHDPDGIEQVEAEEQIAAHLFDEYEMYTPIGHTFWIISYIIETFFQDVLSRPVEDIIQLAETLETYLSTWQRNLEKKDSPDEDEAAQAGRDTLLLTLRYLYPEWVKVDTNE